ncbi:MAG: hypothetical protein RBS16_00470 [Candidatus Cloacimonadales bacterium]|jgi:hypothetical protein|nr:hypothetical protein [Candidatus Cloacimonadota bacterium]MDD2649934.1 hypothetical protein [Candidatus Cloacimonadota bacterium]MDX9976486.1 hypothetical protein [Candidatus Cloacimonadales bacterium]
MRKLKLFSALFIIAISIVTLNAQNDQMSGSVIIGATTINNTNYQHIGFRADIPIWKLGFGLDIQLYIDDQGNVREEDWDEFQDYLDKIYYVRWGHKGDPLYLRVGGLENVNLGYGIVLNNYSNMVQYPTYKRLGMEGSTKFGGIGTEFFINNFKEAFADKPGMLIGARASYDLPFMLVAGATIASDFNQYNGLFDTDGDGYPDAIDAYPNDKRFVTEKDKWRHNLQGAPNIEETIDVLVANGVIDPTEKDELIKYGDKSSSVTIVGADLGMPLIEGDLVELDIYTQVAQIIDHGLGFTLPGIRFKLGPVTTFAEYRHANEEFLFGYFNQTYEIERARTFGKEVITKKELLGAVESMDGYFAGIHTNLFDLAFLNLGYQDLRGDTTNAKSINGEFGITAIPKLSIAKAYYAQNNVHDFTVLKTPSTIMGYVFGYEISSGVSINFDTRFSYEDKNGDGKIKGDNETNKSISIYTEIRF